ncbi:pilus assembly protein TadG-related protein [Arthrobacter sp. MDT3-44]
MRRIASKWKPAAADRERGAISVLVALLMVVFLGFAALAVDVAMVYSERAQLQNGADAAALGIAQVCAKTPSSTLCSSSSAIAADLTNKNALDNLSAVQSVAFSGNKVTVTTAAKEAGRSDNRVSLFFAQALGVSSAEVGARAAAVWGSPTSGIAPFPLTFSICQVQGQVGGSLQLLQAHGDNANPDCNYGPSGAAVPGGFGWLSQSSGQCGAFVDIAVQLGASDPGNNGPSDCDAVLNGWATDLSAGKSVTLLLPVFDQVTGTGAGAKYHLLYFAAYDVKGWAFSGSNNLPMTFNPSVTDGSVTKNCSGSCRGIIGKFIEYVSLADGYTLGPVTSGGVSVVRPSL